MTNDKQRERLVELLSDEINKPTQFTLQSIADYLLANGVIVPPCKVGQTVYAIDRRSQLWWKGTAMSFCYTGTGMEFGVLFDDGEFAVYKDDAVFLTKEEAEAKLKEGVQG